MVKIKPQHRTLSVVGIIVICTLIGVVMYWLQRPVIPVNGTTETKLVTLGDRMYSEWPHYFYYHGLYNDYIVIGHCYGSTPGKGGLCNLYIRQNVTQITLIGVTFKIEEVTVDYIKFREVE